MSERLAASLLVLAVFNGAAWGAGLEDLTPVSGWEEVAHGVWSARLGEVGEEVRYTDLAGAPPKLQRLNELVAPSLPAQLKSAAFRVSDAGQVMVRIPTDPDEKIYGFGLQFDNTMKTGQVIDLKVDHFNKGGGATHAPTPFYISSKGYGVFFNTARYLKAYVQVGNRKDARSNPEEVDRNPPADEPQAGPWLAVPPGDAVEVSINGAGMEVVGFAGKDLLDVVSRYNLYCGGGAMPPLWGLGFWHRVPARYDASQTEQEVDDFEEHNIPLDVIGLEPGWQSKSYPCTFEWQPKRFPDPQGFVQGMLHRGVRLNLWENPYISKHAKLYEAMAPLSGSHMVWLGIVPDYYLPEARRLLAEQHTREHVELGVSGYKIDEVDGYDIWLWPDHATFPSGVSAEAMRQTYGLLLQGLLQKEIFRKRNERTYSLVRASNGAGSAYPFVIYSDSYGHDEYVTGLSSASLSGVLWCPEVRSAGNGREWINRTHTVCFSPLAMLNAWASKTKPWSYPEATDAVRRTIQLRMRLIPYLYTAFAKYHRDGVPPIRSMLLEGQVKSQTLSIDGEIDGETDPYADGFHRAIAEDNSLFMFGPDILVAPFLNSQTSRRVPLPPGDWFDFHTGERAGGGEWLEITAEDTHDLPPLFVRGGSLIPMLKQPVNNTSRLRNAAIELRLYGPGPASCEFYEDDGSSFAYEEGAYRLRRFSVTGDGALTQESLRDGAPRFYGEADVRVMSP